GYIGWIENLDGQNPPKWAAPRYLESNGQPIRILAGENGSIQGPAEAKWGYTTLSVNDWDQDGKLDIVANSIWGKVVWFRNSGTPQEPNLESAQPVHVTWDDSPSYPSWNWWKPAPHELVTQWRTTPFAIDLNDDTLIDLVMLDHEGYLAWFPRERLTDDQLTLRPGRRVFLDADTSSPLQLNSQRAGRSGRRKFTLVDWDQDGDLDLLANAQNVELWENTSGNAPLPWHFKNQGLLGEATLAGHTTSPTTVDWNHDGIPELLVGAEDGYLYYLPREP
ncbi:MAG: VCBS repeat-containing protein, partial [Planctomycetales bacterium]|nr:VCBS repeat-containing protein [Planctomycetales bacterium]